MSLKKVETTSPIAPGTSLAAFTDLSGVPKVIYQATDNTLHVHYGTDGGGKFPSLPNLPGTLEQKN